MAEYAVATVIILGIILAGLLLVRPSLTAAQGGKIIAFLGLFILQVVATVLGASIHVDNSKRTEFCLSCHVMEDHGKSLYIDDPSYLPAAHYQNNRIPKEQACYTCHTSYTIFGDVDAKLRGLRHLYVYYLRPPPEKIALYEPFHNRECLHCHAGARSYEESSPHKEMREPLAGNDMSCLTCHSKIHDVVNLPKLKSWKGSGM